MQPSSTSLVYQRNSRLTRGLTVDSDVSDSHGQQMPQTLMHVQMKSSTAGPVTDAVVVAWKEYMTLQADRRMRVA
jgi:hypothetical protein